MWNRETRKQRRLQRRAERKEKFALPERELCSSCGADERVEHHHVGAIDGTVPLCRSCVRRLAEREERDRAARRAREDVAATVVPHPAAPPARADPPRTMRRPAVRPRSPLGRARRPRPVRPPRDDAAA